MCGGVKKLPQQLLPSKGDLNKGSTTHYTHLRARGIRFKMLFKSKTFSHSFGRRRSRGGLGDLLEKSPWALRVALGVWRWALGVGIKLVFNAMINYATFNRIVAFRPQTTGNSKEP